MSGGVELQRLSRRVMASVRWGRGGERGLGGFGGEGAEGGFGGFGGVGGAVPGIGRSVAGGEHTRIDRVDVNGSGGISSEASILEVEGLRGYHGGTTVAVRASTW